MDKSNLYTKGVLEELMIVLIIVIGSILIGIWVYLTLELCQSKWDKMLDEYFKIDVPNLYNHKTKLK